MAYKFLDTPNRGKAISFDDPGDIGENGEIIGLSKASPDQLFLAVEEGTSITYAIVNGIVAGPVFRYEFDASVDSAAVGSTPLRGPLLPPNARITNGYYNVTEQFTAGGAASIALSIPVDDVGGIRATGNITSLGTLGFKTIIQTGAIATFSEQTTAERQPTIDISGNALTAGKAQFFFTVATETA